MNDVVLVAVAHPDDEVLCCGGTIAWLVDRGVKVVVAFAADGVSSRGHDVAAANARVAAANEAAQLLGVADVTWLAGVPDNESDTVSRLTLARMMVAAVADFRPTRIITHHAGDLNVDHRRVHEAVLVAARPQPGCTVQEILAGEVPSSTEWGLRAFRPTLFVDVTTVYSRKLEALTCYESELRESPHVRSRPAIIARDAWRGGTVGVQRAEAFEVVRIVRSGGW